MTLEAFSDALEAWGKAQSVDDVGAAQQALEVATPAGLTLRPNASALALNVHRKGDSASMALLYLNAPSKRSRDAELVRIAWVAVQAISAAL